MPHRPFKLIYLSHDLTKKVEWSITKHKVRLALAGAAVLFILFNVAVGIVVGKLALSRENQALAQENQRLREHLDQFDDRLMGATQRISELTESDNMLRLMADLPVLDEQVRNVGVGGAVTNPVVDASMPEVNVISWTLDKLDREITLQRASFEEIHEKLIDDAEMLEHMPTLRPIDGGYMSSFFGMRRDPFTKKMTRHYGLDFSTPRGTPVKAAAGGKVVYAGIYYTYGKFVVIDHGSGYETAYGHLHKVSVNVGQTVAKGDLIGQVGSTGRSTSPHLHYEVRVNGHAVNPLDYVFEDDKERFPTLASDDAPYRH